MAAAESVTTSGVVYAVTSHGVARYFGFSLRETAGSAAVCRVREGSVTGKILDTVGLAALGSARQWYGDDGGIICNGDLYFEKVSGTVEGAVFHG